MILQCENDISISFPVHVNKSNSKNKKKIDSQEFHIDSMELEKEDYPSINADENNTYENIEQDEIESKQEKGINIINCVFIVKCHTSFDHDDKFK